MASRSSHPFSIALPTLRDDDETDAFNYDRPPRLDLTALFPSIGVIITVTTRAPEATLSGSRLGHIASK